MRWAAYAGVGIILKERARSILNHQVSATLAAGVLVKALSQRPNFYSAAVYLAQSSANLMVCDSRDAFISIFGQQVLTFFQILTNFIFLCACVLLLGLQKLLFGPLRPIEIEQLYERAWLFVTETCLSMTIFKGSFGAWFMVMFFSLLAGKVWGWIGEGRVEILEQQPPANPRLFHIRLAISLSMSVLFAAYMLDFSVRTVLAQAKPDMMVMFGFEFAILTILAVSAAARYSIVLTEIYVVQKQKTARVNELRAERAAANETSRTEGQETNPSTNEERPANTDVDEAEVEVEGWEGKGRWIFYLDLVTGESAARIFPICMLISCTDFLKLVVYVAFFSVLLGFYGLPLHIMRDLFLSFRSFFKRVADFVRYRNATRDMNARYPDATPEEVGREDICIICREEMRPAPQNVDANGPPQRTNPVTERMRPKKLPCGHILHFACLRSWLERQQNCPTCRRPVVVTHRLQVPAGNGPALPGNADGQDGGAAGPVHQPDQAGRNRARVINFGLLRIGFGAGGGDLIDDLAQRIHNGEPRPPAEVPGNAGGRQHFGFGFGIGRRPNPRNQPSAPSPNIPIQAQLDQIERSLQQQISCLRVASNELHLVRMLNNELARLRNVEANGANTEAGAPHTQDVPFGTLPALVQDQLPHNGLQPPTRHQLTAQPPTILSSHQQQLLSSDSDALPEGVTLPPGWTLLPLQRSDGSNRPVMNNSGVTTTQPATTSPPVVAQNSAGPPPSQPAADFTNPFSSRTPPPGAAADTAHLASPAPRQVSPNLPSWDSGPNRSNGEIRDEQREIASPVRNGQASSGKAVKSADTTGKGKGKANGKAAAVEDLVDDVD